VCVCVRERLKYYNLYIYINYILDYNIYKIKFANPLYLQPIYHRNIRIKEIAENLPDIIICMILYIK